MMWSKLPVFQEHDVTGLLAAVPALQSETVRGMRLIRDHSNEVAEVGFCSGRRLVMKRARYAQLRERLVAANDAARVLWQEAGILAPEGLVVRDSAGEPVLLYWWIEYPTLEDIWPSLSTSQREEALLDWGRLLRRMHQIRVPGDSPLGMSLETGDTFAADLWERLLPAAQAVWPNGWRTIEDLATLAEDCCPAVTPRVFLHGDLFSANVLCEVTLRRVRCVGVLDLEDAFTGPGEADLARTEILHGPLFGRQLEGRWFERLMEGYGRKADPTLLTFFRAYHLLNMGYHAASSGNYGHADDVAHAASLEVRALT